MGGIRVLKSVSAILLAMLEEILVFSVEVTGVNDCNIGFSVSSLLEIMEFSRAFFYNGCLSSFPHFPQAVVDYFYSPYWKL